MDHARHLSSPSPTSSFLFHHTERPFKSNLLNPSLLSSSEDMTTTSVDDCFSSSTSISDRLNQHHAFSDNQNGPVDENDEQDDDPRNTILVNNDDDNGPQTQKENLQIIEQQLQQQQHQHSNHHQDDQDNHDCLLEHTNEHTLNGVDAHDAVVGDVDHHDHDHHNNDHDHDDDDDDDGMHNMISGSSTSSTTTMPLLTDNHSHHPFSRLSLGGYSPLSLVDDCDNALPISPTSLACGSHHSPFKTSLNNLKMDNLDGVDVGVHDHVDDVVNDTRSMSPSLLSGGSTSVLQNHHHHPHLWSTSSTAITQNPTLLTSTSTSFLLSHHHHQLNTLMQQLEPQSLDEPPPLLAPGSGLSFEHDPSGMNHRPSSEPPPGCGLDSHSNSTANTNIETKSVSSQSSITLPPNLTNQTTKTKQRSRSKNTALPTISGSQTTTTTRSSSRRSRSKTVANISIANKSNNHMDKLKLSNASTTSSATPYCDSKAHLQLNHHEKLKELQQRLFGTVTCNETYETIEQVKNSTEDSDINNNNKGQKSIVSEINQSSLALKITKVTHTAESVCKQDVAQPTTSSSNTSEEADSSASITNLQASVLSNDVQSNLIGDCNKLARSRPNTRQRKSRAAKKDTSSNTTTNLRASQRLVATETAEPDTTTKTSDCIKLADLLTSTSNSDLKNYTFMLDNSSSSITTDNNNSNNNNTNEKRYQQIQLQVNPSLTVVASNGVMQTMNLQQQQRQNQTTNNLTVVKSGFNSFDNQVVCRPVSVMAPVAGNNSNTTSSQQIKYNLVPSSDTNWSSSSNQTINSNNDNNTNNSNNNQHSLNAHQIAIQVICQDGTSLVLPVSSAASLNAAVSLATNQTQQLQVIGNMNGANNQQHQVQKGPTQVIPIVSINNIVTQQQNNNNNNNSTNGTCTNSSNSQATQTSGLAASSPTLAALLDAGSSRSYNNNLAQLDLSNIQHIVSSNLKVLKKEGCELIKSGEFSIQPGTQLGLTSNGSLVTFCSTGTNTDDNNNNKRNLDQVLGVKHLVDGDGDKRVKMDNNNNFTNAAVSGMQTTFTIIDPQGLIVANGNDNSKLLQAANTTTTTTTTTTSHNNETTNHLQATNTTNSSGQQVVVVNNDNNAGNIVGPTIIQQQHNMTANTTKSNSDVGSGSNGGKQSKMTSSTGNRQVDPTQPFRCEHCNSTFTRLGNFTRHKKIHTVPTKDGQRFKCDVCSKSFLQRCDLARHLHIHRGTEPHRCDICGKGYIRHSDLVTHQRFHNKEKPFGCPHCSKGFCQRGDLNRHLRSIHLQMKPILCPCCNRKFAKQETLLRHVNSAHRNKPNGTNTNSTIIAQIAPIHAITQSNNDKQQATISLVATNVPSVLEQSTTNGDQKSQVASLQAIHATLCKVQQSVDPSSNIKLEIPTSESAAATS